LTERRLELLARRGDGDRLTLRSPAVGLFTGAAARAGVLTEGAAAGTLLVLGAAVALVVPAGTSGRIASERPERVREPVGYGTVLYDLIPLSGAGETFSGNAGADGAATTAAEGLFIRARHSGRFWQRAAPGEPPFVAAGTVVEPGQPIGLIEVMKTFSHVRYEAIGGLPERARVVRVVTADGEEVAEGTPLVEVEPA
jgi:acetyl-CoA carboxylase biotin carboxyl carrier protein